MYGSICNKCVDIDVDVSFQAVSPAPSPSHSRKGSGSQAPKAANSAPQVMANGWVNDASGLNQALFHKKTTVIFSVFAISCDILSH